ncbi:MAG: adenylate/guanylate cyclase domain-containing protein [Pseudomonadota bacterium]|nr:adenylate/guanylate cyclase domain-containing protein [Pseudomonadota bacterium]
MTEKKIDRKIAVIFVTDVVGFSKLMEKNEAETLQSFRACKEILDNLFTEHSGRIFNTAGDSVLAEFQSAVSAVICASEFQKLIKERNSNVKIDSQMHFRIGLNMGDVIVEGENLYGDGVNVAARLEALSQPDGVCLSKSIHDFVAQKTELLFNDIGEQKVKNTTVYAFDLALADLERRNSGVNDSASDTEEVSKPPAIAVLPFKNLSNDEEQEYFADGITEDIISNLSLWKTFPVISRNSSFSFKGTKDKSADIAKALGVSYLVEGSVRKAGTKVRITAQLNFALEDKQIWSKRWDRSLEDIFEVQDEVSQSVAALISPALKDQERLKLRDKTKKNFGAWDEYLQGLSIYNSDVFMRDADKVIEHCKRALELDANFCDAYVLYCNVLQGAIYNHEKQAEREGNEKLFHQLAHKAVTIDPENPDALSTLSLSYSIKRDYQKRLELAEKALDINPNHPRTNFHYGQALSNFGKFEETLKYVNKAIELDPFSRRNYEGFFVLLYIALKDWGNALHWCDTLNERGPHSRFIGWKAAILGNMGKISEAKSHLALFKKERPEINTISDYEKVAPLIIKDVLIEGLRAAGLEER